MEISEERLYFKKLNEWIAVGLLILDSKFWILGAPLAISVERHSDFQKNALVFIVPTSFEVHRVREVR